VLLYSRENDFEKYVFFDSDQWDHFNCLRFNGFKENQTTLPKKVKKEGKYGLKIEFLDVINFFKNLTPLCQDSIIKKTPEIAITLKLKVIFVTFQTMCKECSETITLRMYFCRF
jgi:hypothetical protein